MADAKEVEPTSRKRLTLPQRSAKDQRHANTHHDRELARAKEIIQRWTTE